MVDLQRSCNKRMISVVAVIFLVNIVLYAVKFVSITPLDGGTSENIQEYEENRDLGAIFAARQHHLRDVCLMKGHFPPLSVAESTFNGGTIVETTHNILYCPVEKVGSTFWKKTLTAMSRQGRLNSPFQVKLSKNNKLELYQNFPKSSNGTTYQKTATSLIVVRDPYTKLFSAYVDKLYHPNYLFWKITGEQIAKMTKNKISIVCGNDISFSSFIKYIISRTQGEGMNLNPHFTPLYMHCHPCKAKYDFIMKFENFKEDLYYIIDNWNARFNLNITFQDFERQTAIDVASKHINISFSTIKMFSKVCNVPVHNFLLRTWRFLQITGLLPKEIDMPFPNNESSSRITKEMYLNVIKDVLSRDIDWARVKKQRHEALVQAYQSIDKTDIEKLRKIVRPDCQYFDYNETPHYLFEKSSEKFNYFDGISMF
ncbi:carbohydrate sulfotransferase 12-like [Mercenaria mercenaria]|uniref:carbohydrate sulfotransferase 12-like n=1 Tax=Mercenaria mercenaria TaxID=6596 RepID=UPI00234F4693|nr:carbohydrate sulfotransferase 12-like [Mercenaria mercenaria]